MHKILYVLPLSISLPVFYIGLALLILWRYLVSTAVGALFFSVFLYFLIPVVSDIPALTWQELVFWVDALGPDYKVALLGSGVTIIGFIVAFHTATLNWKAQMNAEISVQAAAEIESFFARVQESIRDSSIYIENLIETVNKIKGGCSQTDAEFSVRYYLDQREKYFESRRRLSQATIDIHGLIGRYHNVFATNWAYDSLRNSTKALSEVVGAMWVHIPEIPPGHPTPVQNFINELDIAKCQLFISLCEKNIMCLSATPGGIRGRLLSPIFGLNLSMLVQLVKDHKVVKASFEKMKPN